MTPVFSIFSTFISEYSPDIALNKWFFKEGNVFQYSFNSSISEFGIPQKRDRIIILGLSKEIYGEEASQLLNRFYIELLPKYKCKKKKTVQSKTAYKSKGETLNKNKAKGVFEKGGVFGMKRKEWNEGLNNIDPELVEKYIQQKEKFAC